MLREYELVDDLPATIQAKLGPMLIADSRTATAEALVWRLLSGTATIREKRTGKSILQTRNYSTLPSKETPMASVVTLHKTVTGIGFTKLEAHFKQNRKNANFFRDVLGELCNFFFRSSGSHLASFVYLYRTLEFISYAFPCLYVTSSGSYYKTFDSLKSFFGTDVRRNELKFFESFQNEMLDPLVLDATTTLDMYVTDPAVARSYYQLIRSVAHQATNGDFVDNGTTITLKNRYLVNFMIVLRNRYFHMLAKRQDNITSYDIIPEPLFHTLNRYFIDWIGFLYFEILRLSASQP